MQAVIMAGGKGTRLTSITQDLIPKPMVEILGKPLLEWQIEILREYNITDICFVIGHLGEKIKEYFGNGEKHKVRISYIEEREPLGTAGAFYYLNDWLEEENFFLIFGDVFFDIDLKRMLDFHIKKNSTATLFVHPNSHPFDSDLIIMNREAEIVGFDSKHNKRDYWYENCVNAGLYIFNRKICSIVKEPVKMDLEKEVLAKTIEDGNIYGYRSPEYIKDVGTVERIATTIQDINSGFIKARNLSNKQKCIFLDRDGTVNILKGFLSDINNFELENGVVDAIEKVNHSEWLCIVVTNQPVVARGMCDIDDIEKIHQKLSTLLGRNGVYLDDVKYCPHHPDKGYPGENLLYKISCCCRKPGIGMLKLCEKEYNIDLKQSWIVGDTSVDIQTGINAGMHTALVLTGEAGKDGKYNVYPELTGDTLLQIVDYILSR